MDLLDEINLIDSSRRFRLRMPNELVQELDGHGAKSAEGQGITRSQITSWLVQGICPNFRAWDLDLRVSSPRTIAQSLRTFGWAGKDG